MQDSKVLTFVLFATKSYFVLFYLYKKWWAKFINPKLYVAFNLMFNNVQTQFWFPTKTFYLM